jgi:hypothetical protein
MDASCPKAESKVLKKAQKISQKLSVLFLKEEKVLVASRAQVFAHQPFPFNARPVLA